MIELAAHDERRPHDLPDPWIEAVHQLGNGFRVQASTELLKVGRQEHQVALVDLLRRMSTASSGRTYGTVCRFQLVQRGGCRLGPVPESLR